MNSSVVDDLVANADLRASGGLRRVRPRPSWRGASNGEGLIAEGQLGRLCNDGAIDAAREGHGTMSRSRGSSRAADPAWRAIRAPVQTIWSLLSMRGQLKVTFTRRTPSWGVPARRTAQPLARTARRKKSSTAMPWRRGFREPAFQHGGASVPGCVIRALVPDP